MTTTKYPLLSVITVSYNAKDTIEKTINSVINQTYPNIEYIIIDGGSKDGTIDIIRKYSKYITYWISEPDKGIYDAMNKGIIAANGQWINFMNAGDIFYNNHTIESIHFENFNNHYTKVIYGDTIKRKTNSEKRITPKNVSHITRGIICCHQSTFVSLINKSEIIFDINYKISSDYNQLYKIYNKYKKNTFKYIPQIVSIFDGEYGLSSKNRLQLFKEQLIIRSNHRNIIWYLDYIRFKLRVFISFIKKTL